jgi:hypothetical protein
MRRDLQPVRTGDDISVDLRILTARRTDKACDRTRAINRLRAQLLEYFPALEQAFDYSRSKSVLSLARRRLNVLWAMLRDGATYELQPAPCARAA